MFASKSLSTHLLRGMLGASAFALAYYLAEFSVAGWAILVPAFIAWRGCPTCWAIGLYQTAHNRIAARKLERHCVDGRCELRPSELNALRTPT